LSDLQVIKIRLQNQHGLDKTKLKYTGPLDVVMKMTKQEGMLSLWTGATPTVFRNGLNQGEC
jgi:solute carrier family 25 (mitochondrial citrate transporter), member 1